MRKYDNFNILILQFKIFSKNVKINKSFIPEIMH